MAGHLLAWERHERDRSWWAWVSWVHETGGRRDHKVVLVRADSLRPLEPPEAYKTVPRRVRGLDGQIRRSDITAVGADCCQDCCHDRGQLRTEDDRPGTSAPGTATPGHRPPVIVD
jgi:hypothetical protein